MQVLANIISPKNLVSFKFLLFISYFILNNIVGFYQNYKMFVSFEYLKFEVPYVKVVSEYQMNKIIHIKTCIVKWNSKSRNYILQFD
jgi:hypothetical protein